MNKIVFLRSRVLSIEDVFKWDFEGMDGFFVGIICKLFVFYLVDNGWIDVGEER